MITPPPIPARLVKLKKEGHRFSIYLFILLFNCIVLITKFGKIWVAGKAEPMPPRVAASLGGPPRVAVSLQCE